MKPVKGLYAVTPDLADTRALAGKVTAVLAGGARLLQYRNKLADGAKRREQAAALLAVCRRFDAALIINDDVELASEIAADGAHIGRDDMTLAVARARLGGERMIGVSCYDDLARAQAAVRAGADYIAFGSFYTSRSKPGAVRAPLALLSAARPFGLPVVAIGGITLDNAAALIEAGADAVAVISALFDAPDPESAARGFCRLFNMGTRYGIAQ